ncbi:trehalose operon repressor [Virgibacillus sp. MSP4-1]|uniref:trehalose operon repressor n=1 Tax=Virgibacillus sp. MSP4-1 TaxID=2700081 RepID=UPI00039A23E8|nr:trehalose operon repressor [Virgibacillus sp. MSP4-1]QHS23265.1 trehalose operon repressor [Virgibacillus sp. MSP4-1]
MKKKYLAIYEDLVEKIREHTLPASTLLPSENELAGEYATSRETIRKALDLLSQEGYIQKIHGKGSVVLDLNKFSFPVSGIVSYKELADRLKLDSKTHVKGMNVLEAGSDVHKILKATDESQIWKVDRVREISGEKIILDKDYFLSEFVPLLPREICESSIYDYAERELGLTISFAEKEITVEEPTEEDAELLDLEGYSSIVVIKSLVYLEDTSLFQYTESRHRPDKFRFVDFARRVKT